MQVGAQQTCSANMDSLEVASARGRVVLLNNSQSIVPLIDVTRARTAVVHLDGSRATVMDSMAAKYCKATIFNFNLGSLLSVGYGNLKSFDSILIGLSSGGPFTDALEKLVKRLSAKRKIVLIVDGNGTDLDKLSQLGVPVIYTPNSGDLDISAATQAVFGGIGVVGKLARDIGQLKTGTGFTTDKIRLGYSVPESVGVRSLILAGIDSIVAAGIADHSAPGVVVLVAKKGEVIFNRAYGTHTYLGAERTKIDDIFDMASVTKITATTPSIMRLYDKRKIALDDPISKYVPSLRHVIDKKDISIREALLHEAGFTPYIKFYELLKADDTSKDSSAAYPTKVADHYFLRKNFFKDVMWPLTINSKVVTRGKFVYSDLSMYMMKEVVESTCGEKLNAFVFKEIYQPLGMQVTGYLPRDRFPKSRIIPTTENDHWFRDMTVQGYVNDPGAAMAGGVQGHAGLFSNANDLAIFYQMLLNKGQYGGRMYFKPETVDLFTSAQSKNSWRGLGFDRAHGDKESEKYQSAKAFGHGGYTGTYVWVDPKYDLVYVCLTNRVYPDINATSPVSKINIQSEVLSLIYKALVAGDHNAVN